MDAFEVAREFKGSDNPLRFRQGEIVAVNSDWTVDVTIGGSETVVPGVRHLSAYPPYVGDGVWIATDGRDLFVMGPLAPYGRALFTPDGGVAVRMKNGTGAATVKGSLVSASTTNDFEFILQNNEYDTFGIVYESGIAAGGEALVVVSGIADVLVADNITVNRGTIAIASQVDGRATAVANPGSGLPATDTHFREIGHFIQYGAPGTNVLVRAVLHFN